jgi:threonine dehydrogenase-like Zn-dependent dehydrogenase
MVKIIPSIRRYSVAPVGVYQLIIRSLDALVQVGDRVVSCFDIACGGCGSCKRGLFTSCDTTNPSEAMQAMYGDRSAGA